MSVVPATMSVAAPVAVAAISVAATAVVAMTMATISITTTIIALVTAMMPPSGLALVITVCMVAGIVAVVLGMHLRTAAGPPSIVPIHPTAAAIVVGVLARDPVGHFLNSPLVGAARAPFPTYAWCRADRYGSASGCRWRVGRLTSTIDDMVAVTVGIVSCDSLRWVTVATAAIVIAILTILPKNRGGSERQENQHQLFHSGLHF
jgi:hypothetical protein